MTDVATTADIAAALLEAAPSGLVRTFLAGKVPSDHTQISLNPLGVQAQGFCASSPFPVVWITSSFPTGIAGGIPAIGNPKLYVMAVGNGFSCYDLIAQTWTSGLASRPSVPGDVEHIFSIPAATTSSALGSVSKNANTLLLSLYNSSGSLAAYLYNVDTGLWTSGATCSVAKTTAVSLAAAFDNTGLKLYAFGGGTDDIVYYDVEANTWTTTGTTLSIGAACRAICLPSGKFLLLDITNWVYYLYDPVAGTVSSSSPVPFTKGNIVGNSNGYGAFIATDTGAAWIQGDQVQAFVEGTGWSSSGVWGPMATRYAAPIPGTGTFFIYFNAISYMPEGNQIFTTVQAAKN